MTYFCDHTGILLWSHQCCTNVTLMIYFHLGLDNGAPIDYGASDSAVVVAPEKPKIENLLWPHTSHDNFLLHKCYTHGTLWYKSHTRDLLPIRSVAQKTHFRKFVNNSFVRLQILRKILQKRWDFLVINYQKKDLYIHKGVGGTQVLTNVSWLKWLSTHQVIKY